MKKKIFCIIGESGAGKSTLEDIICSKKDFIPLRSYTTRPKRSKDDNTHTFVTEEEFDKLSDIVAFNKYGSYRYGATSQQINESDTYVIDIPGIKDLKNNYKGPKEIFVIGLKVSPNVAMQRMFKRGDKEEKVFERIALDGVYFQELDEVSDIVINTDSMTSEDVYQKIKKYL